MKITVIPYKAPRKHRKQECLGTVVKWIEGNMMQFRWFSRDSAAMNFVDELVEQGIPSENIVAKQK
jgi:hypothetical protein